MHCNPAGVAGELRVILGKNGIDDSAIPYVWQSLCSAMKPEWYHSYQLVCAPFPFLLRPFLYGIFQNEETNVAEPGMPSRSCLAMILFLRICRYKQRTVTTKLVLYIAWQEVVLRGCR